MTGVPVKRAVMIARPAAAVAAAAAGLVWLALPEAAAACAVCTGGQTDEVRYAFLWTTGLLSALPVGLVGGVVWYLRRRARELASRRDAHRREPEAPAFTRSAASP